MKKKGLILKHTKKEGGDIRYQGVVSLGGGCKIVGPMKEKRSIAKQKVEQGCRKLGIEVEWIGE